MKTTIRICPDCSRPLVSAHLSNAFILELRRFEGQIPASALGLINHCADCFWWRVALLIGYCIL